MGSLGMIDALGRGPVALVFFLELHRLLVFRGTTSVITVHHRGKDDASPDEDERLEQPREEPPHGEVGEVVCSKSPIKLPTPKGSGGLMSCADPMGGEEATPGSYGWLGF